MFFCVSLGIPNLCEPFAKVDAASQVPKTLRRDDGNGRRRSLRSTVDREMEDHNCECEGQCLAASSHGKCGNGKRKRGEKPTGPLAFSLGRKAVRCCYTDAL